MKQKHPPQDKAVSVAGLLYASKILVAHLDERIRNAPPGNVPFFMGLAEMRAAIRDADPKR